MSHTNTSSAFGDSKENGIAGTNATANTAGASERELTAELFVRSLAPAGARERQGAVLKRLDRLANDGCLTEYTVTVWGSGICPETTVGGTEPGRSTLDTIAEFETWATENDLCFRAGFERRAAGSIATEGETTVIEFPTMCLAIRAVDSDAVLCVAPCSGASGDTEHSIADCLDDLAGTTETSDHDWS